MMRAQTLPEDLKLEDYTKTFPGTITKYLDYRVQMAWFWRVYPDGAILPSNPEPDAFKTEKTYVCTCDVYTDVKNPIPSARRSGIASPKYDASVPGEENKVDNPYALSQIIAISNALETLGFMPDILTNAEKEALEKQLLEVAPGGELPAEVQQYNKDTVTNTESKVPERLKIETPAETPVEATEKTEEPIQETQGESTEAPKTRRIRATKAEMEARRAAATTEKVEAPAETVSEPSKEEPVEEVSPTEENALSLEDAKATVCGYRNLKGKTMEEVCNLAATGDKLSSSFIDWCKNSTMAPTKYPNEYNAIKVINSALN